MSILLRHPPTNKKQIVKNGLVLYLDGKDFTNSPPTSTWRDRSNGSQYSYNNLVSNSDFSNGTTGWVGDKSTISATNNILTSIADGSAAYSDTYRTIGSGYASHKYYVRAIVNVANSLCTTMKLMLSTGTWVTAKSQSTPTANINYTLSGIASPSADGALNYIIAQYYADATTANGKAMNIQQVMAIDLTTIFGAGNEPSQSWCDANLGFVKTSGTVNKGNDATPSNFGYTTSSGSDNNGGVVFDGVDDCCTVSAFNPPSSFTLEETITTGSDVTTEQHVMEFQTTQQYISNSKLYFKIGNSINSSSNSLQANTKYHIVCVYTSSSIQMYINGSLVASGIPSGSPSIGLFIGRLYSAGYFMKCKLYNARIYNRALSQSEILQNYNASK